MEVVGFGCVVGGVGFGVKIEDYFVVVEVGEGD